MWLLNLFALVLAFLVSAASGWAQVAGAISGTVEDASGAAMSGVTVTVKSLEIGTERIVTTDEAGNYTVLSLPVGLQEVKAKKKGFKTAVRTGINLSVGQRAVV